MIANGSLDRASMPSRIGPKRPSRAPAHEDTGDFLVVGIAASADDLDACAALLSGLPIGVGMAFILVQTEDSSRRGVVAELESRGASVTVREAADGTPIEREHLYVVPPGVHASVSRGVLRFLESLDHHDLPFDLLLHSLAKAYGPRAVCVILSGARPHGAIGLRTVVESGGLVIARDPREAGYDELLRGAIATGAVDLLLPLARIAEALEEHARRIVPAQADSGASRGSPNPPATTSYAKVVDLLLTATHHDFTHYKESAVRRRIERRMATAEFDNGDLERYYEKLRGDPIELASLAKDLLTNVTGFFRDRRAFDMIARDIVPDLVRSQPPNRPLRLWVAGCGAGEEAYSLAMLFLEEISNAGSAVELQIFASDVEPDAVATARKGLYPRTIETDVSPERLARFFSRKGDAHEVLPEVRATVLFAVQNVLADPPYSRLDLVSCGNLLVDLNPEGQAKVIAAFDFALRDGGILVLGGGAEIAGDSAGRFSVISNTDRRLYRHIGHAPWVGSGSSSGARAALKVRSRVPGFPTLSSRSALADLCRRLVFETYAPAAVLINQNYECLYSLGPTHRHLRVAPESETRDLLALAPAEIRNTIRSAVHRAGHERGRVLASGGHASHDGREFSLNIAVHPVVAGDEMLMLVCFIDDVNLDKVRSRQSRERNIPEILHLRQELSEVKTELQDAIRDFETSSEELRARNEEAYSVNEEYQSVNEELLASKAELHAINNELMAINDKLQESQEHQLTTLSTFQDVLFSTDVATLLVDADLKIQLFTPATKSLFNVIAGDLGRPLADLRLPADDDALLRDARTTLRTLAPIETEIKAENGDWYIRRTAPFRAHDKAAEGVVVTFTDITGRKRAAVAAETALQLAERANITNARLLAEASQDLRIPLQTFARIQGLLTETVKLESERHLVAKLGEAMRKMSGILKPIIDAGQVETDSGRPVFANTRVDDIFHRLRDKLVNKAEGANCEVRVAKCRLLVRSDPRLLEEMIGHLLSNALKYTKRGRVLLGCRRRGDALSIEVWDTGIGIPEIQLDAISKELHRVDDGAPSRGRGFGLGLSNVRRLSAILNHRVNVRSTRGRGSVFTIEVMLATEAVAATPRSFPRRLDNGVPEREGRGDSILVIEHDARERERIGLLLEREGYVVSTANDGFAAIELVTREYIRPDLIIADYNLPNGMNGLDVATLLRERLHARTPVIIISGEVENTASSRSSSDDYSRLHEHAQSRQILEVIRRLLSASAAPAKPRLPRAAHAAHGPPPTVFAIVDDRTTRDMLHGILEEEGWAVDAHATAEAFLDAYRPGRDACLLIDANLPRMSALELMRRLEQAGHELPVIMISGNNDVSVAVQAMKAGASDFIEKPISREDLLASVRRAFERSNDPSKLPTWRRTAVKHFASLTFREREIMKMVLAGISNKNIAADLKLSQRTVENHRASVMKKTGATSLPALARLALAAEWIGTDEASP